MLFLILFAGVLCVAFYSLFSATCLTLVIRILIPSFVRVPGISLSLNAALCFSLLSLLLLRELIGRKKTKDKTFFYPLVMGWVFFLLCLLFIPRDLPLALQFSGWMKNTYTDLLLPVIVCFSVRNAWQVKRLCAILFGTVFIAGVYGIFTYVIKLNPYMIVMGLLANEPVSVTGMMSEVRGALEGRIQSTLSHPLVWGQIVNVFFCFLLLMRCKRKLYLLLLAVLFLNLFLCGSRSVLLSGLMAIGLSVWQIPFKKLFAYALSGLVGLVVILNVARQNDELALYVDTVEATLFFWNQEKSDDIGVKGSSVSLRKDQLSGAFQLVGDCPLTGLGQGWIHNYQVTKGLHPVMLGFESVAYSKLVEIGMLGFVMWLAFYFRLYHKTVLFMKRHKVKYDVKIYFFPYFVSLLMTDSFESFYLFLVLIILLCKYVVFEESSDTDFQKDRLLYSLK